MQHQFKPGDLTLTLADCGNVPSGSVVEFIRIMPAGEQFTMKGDSHTNPRDCALVVRDDARYLYEPEELMPLRDDHAPQLEKQKEVRHG